MKGTCTFHGVFQVSVVLLFEPRTPLANLFLRREKVTRTQTNKQQKKPGFSTRKVVRMQGTCTFHTPGPKNDTKK
jgi:hypothetical protein